MTTIDTGYLPVNAELRVIPHPGIDVITYDLLWRLVVNGGDTSAGPAGTADLHLPGGATAVFDYADPSRLLTLALPYGTVEAREGDDAGPGDFVGLGAFETGAAELIDALFGPEVRHHLETAAQLTQTLLVAPLPTWLVAGRIALVQTYLDYQCEPLDGLWALEVAARVSELAHTPALLTWAGQLLGDARAALDLLDDRWPERVPMNDEGRRRLQLDLWTCADLGGYELGALARRFRHDRNELIEGAEVWRESHIPDPPYGRLAAVGARVSTDKPPWGTGHSLDTRAGPTVLIDHSAAVLVAGDPLATVEESQLAVTVWLNNELQDDSLERRLMVRATDGNGRLVAAGLSMRAVNPSKLTCQLTLPPAVAPSDLTVVVGRHLPLAAFTPQGFHTRQATHFSVQLVDALRMGEPAPTLRSSAASSWEKAGRAHMADGVDRLPIQPPFLPEVLQTADIANVDRDPPDTTAMQGLRSLAWSFGHVARAAQLEARRLKSGGDPGELTVRQLDALALAAAAQGDAGTEECLESQAIKTLYD